VKRGRERDIDPNQDQRDEAPQGPLWVEPIAPPRSERARYGLPAMIVLFVVLALAVAMATRYVTYFSTGDEPTPTPAGPTPITWVNTTVLFAPLDTPAPTTSPSGSPLASGATTAPTASPTAAASPATTAVITSAPSRPVQSIRASIEPVFDIWYVGTENHFTVELTNTSAGPVYMSPCPVYRMYVTGTDPAAATLRLLNCAAIGETLEPGRSVFLDMVYTPTAADPRGPNQQLVWQWVSPDNIQATTTSAVYIAG